MRHTLIKDGIVVNVIEAPEDYAAPEGLVLGPGHGEIGQRWDGTAFTSPGPPPASPEDLLNRLAGLRWLAENAGTKWGSLPLPTDRIRRTALKDAADKLRDGTLQEPISVAFSPATYALVTLAQLDAAVDIIAVYVQNVFSAAHAIAAKVLDGTITTYEQLDAAWEKARPPSE